ncbi:hypothetical protein V9L00_15910 [Pseudoxanthomonas sp. CCNWLW206]
MRKAHGFAITSSPRRGESLLNRRMAGHPAPLLLAVAFSFNEKPKQNKKRRPPPAFFFIKATSITACSVRCPHKENSAQENPAA